MSNSESFGEYVSNAIISQRDGETLYSGTHQGTGREVVIRCFQKSAFDNDKVAERVEADARKSIERRHKNVLMCFELFSWFGEQVENVEKTIYIPRAANIT